MEHFNNDSILNVNYRINNEQISAILLMQVPRSGVSFSHFMLILWSDVNYFCEEVVILNHKYKRR